MLEIRAMSLEDVDFALDITSREDWEYSSEDFERMLFYEPKGCFLTLEDGKACGLVTTITYGKLGWIGNVVVDSGFRGQGIGERLVVHALGYLKSCAARVIRLASYLNTREFYLELGFEEEGYCHVFSCDALANSAKNLKEKKSENIKKMEPEDLQQVVSIDRKIFGFERTRLLRRLLEDFPHLCFLSSSNEDYVMGSDSSELGEIGPWICTPQIEKEDAESMLLASMGASRAPRFNIVVHEENERSIAILKSLELKPEYKVAIMRFGEPLEFAKVEGIFAMGSLAQG